MTTTSHTHRRADSSTVHIMQVADLTACHTYAPVQEWVEHDGPIGLGTDYRRCIACSAAMAKVTR